MTFNHQPSEEIPCASKNFPDLIFQLFKIIWISAVGIATYYGLDDRMIGVRMPAGAGTFSLRHRVQAGTPILGVPGALSLWLKRPGCEVDHSPPSGVEVKECVELYLHSHNTPSWRGAPLRKAQRRLYLTTLTDELHYLPTYLPTYLNN
jgi:hypothetical protein